jgi:hypothetical protein
MKVLHLYLSSEGPEQITLTDVDRANFGIVPGQNNSQETIMLDLIAKNPELLNTDPEIKAWKEQHDTIHKVNNENPEDEVVENEVPEDEVVEDEAPEEVKVETKKPIAKKTETKPVQLNPFNKGKATDYSNVTSENLAQIVKDRFGITVNDPKLALPTLLSSYEKQRANATKVTELLLMKSIKHSLKLFHLNSLQL